MDFDDPNLDMRCIAEGFGAPTEKIENVESINGVLERSLAHRGPSFLIIEREP
jgi:benzoylformate decarboxylase